MFPVTAICLLWPQPAMLHGSENAVIKARFFPGLDFSPLPAASALSPHFHDLPE